MKQQNNDPIQARNGWKDFTDMIGLNPETFPVELRQLLMIYPKPAAVAKLLMVLIGTVFLPVTMVGLLIGYVRAYKRFMYIKGEAPRMNNLPFIVKFSMALGVIFVWTLFIVAVCLLRHLLSSDFSAFKVAIIYCLTNFIISIAAYKVFRRWYIGYSNLLLEINQHGSARYADRDDVAEYTDRSGLFIGGDMTLADKGHVCTFAGSRGGKSANLIVNALLGIGGYLGSFFVIDPKGELAAICSRALREMGKKVVILNPWELLKDNITGSDTYNPLDILSDGKSSHLIDDVGIMVEMLLPPKANDHNSFFTDSARNLISGLLLHLVCSEKYQKPTLTDLWKMCRLVGEDWDNLLADMATSTHPVNGEAIRQAANEILKQMASPETFSSILSNALEATSFLKSQAIQKTIVSGFSPATLADGNTVVFFTIPADKLRSQSALMRLVTVSMLRAVVRTPREKVTFIIDEAAFLGAVSEFPTALAAYAGFNITMWLVYQDLSQIKSLYGDLWESIIANCAVRQYFSLKDNFTCEYVSKALGTTTDTVFQRDWLGNVLKVENTKRDLGTPDEVRGFSKEEMFIFTGENNAILVPKAPYYFNPALMKDGKPIYDPNPYIKNSK